MRFEQLFVHTSSRCFASGCCELTVCRGLMSFQSSLALENLSLSLFSTSREAGELGSDLLTSPFDGSGHVASVLGAFGPVALELLSAVGQLSLHSGIAPSSFFDFCHKRSTLALHLSVASGRLGDVGVEGLALSLEMIRASTCSLQLGQYPIVLFMP